MTQQEYQDLLMEQAKLSNEMYNTYGYVSGWVASQCVQMYELLTAEQQQRFADKLLYSLNQLQAEQDGEEVNDNQVEIH